MHREEDCMKDKDRIKMIIILAVWLITMIVVVFMWRYQFRPFEGDQTRYIRIDRLTGSVETIDVTF